VTIQTLHCNNASWTVNTVTAHSLSTSDGGVNVNIGGMTGLYGNIYPFIKMYLLHANGSTSNFANLGGLLGSTTLSGTVTVNNAVAPTDALKVECGLIGANSGGVGNKSIYTTYISQQLNAQYLTSVSFTINFTYTIFPSVPTILLGNCIVLSTSTVTLSVPLNFLRFRHGDSTYALSVSESTGAVKVKHNGVTYSVETVDVENQFASPVRVCVGGVTKALKYYTENGQIVTF
jgi:hypothetical protein